MYQNHSDTALAVIPEPKASSPLSIPSKANTGTITGYKGLFDINGDGILDAFYGASIFVSNNNSYTEKKIEGYTDRNIYWDYVYQLNDDIMVCITDSYYHTLMTFSKSDLKLIEKITLTAVPADVDNDGQMEYLASDGDMDIYYKIAPDGKIKSYPLPIFVPDTKTEENEGDTGRGFVAWDYSMLSASMSQMFGRDGGSGSKLAADDIFQIMDFNGDGLPDFIKKEEYQGAKIYINIGNGTYYAQSFAGSTFFADFNGDGICDYVVADGTKLTCCLTDPEGGAPSEKTILSGFTLKNIWCKDIDKDGDSDLVLIVTGTSQCFGVIMENNGTGTFRRHEYSLPFIEVYNVNCLLYDWDNDGNYEILSVSTKDNASDYLVYSNKIIGTTINTNPDEIKIDGLKERNINYYAEPSNGMIKAYALNVPTQTLSDNPNTRPTPPAQEPSLVYEANTGLLKISWLAGNDAETPVSDLTYSVRVGTSSGSDDVINAQALPDGMRLWSGEGNAGRMLYRIYDTSSWPKGKLYVSVQTVDGNMQGSKFSTEAVFDKPLPACEFQMAYCDYFAVNDTLTLTINRLEGTPQWNIEDGRIEASSGNIYKAIFAKSGEKTISLSMTDEAGNISAPKVKKLKVLETSLHADTIVGKRDNELVDVHVCTTFDMDEDGKDEIYCSKLFYNEGSFLKADNQGVYSKIDKMFNSHEYAEKFYDKLSSSPFTGTGTFDINRDGLCDIAFQEYIGYNLGDLDMEFENTGGGKKTWLDLDNDGLYDAVDIGAAYRNDGDYKSFRSKHVYFGDATLFGDFNHDGLIDIADAKQRGNAVNILYNNGDFTFTESETIVLPDNFDFNGLKAVEDIDSDGKLDVLFQNIYHYNGEDSWTLLLGNGLVIKKQGTISGYFDFNNDGIKDIVISDSIFYLSNGSLIGEKIQNFGSYGFGEDSYVLSDGSRYITKWMRYSGGAYMAYPLHLSVNNERPLPPSNLRHTQNEKFVKISWDHSADKETPAAQMRYNISVKHKGVTGEGAYVFSPANSGKNGVRVPLHKPLLETNCITIPVANIPAGDYEVKVQGVDLMHDQSDFSETYEMHVAESSYIDAPTSGEVNVPVRIKVLSNINVDTDWDGGTLKHVSSGVYEVVWATPGIKVISIDGQQSKIKIDNAPNPEFTLPDGIRYGDVVTFKGSMVNTGFWYSVESKYSGEYNPDEGWIYYDEETSLFTPNKFADFEIIDSETASITFKKYNGVVIRHSISSSFSTQTCDRGVNIPADNNVTGISQKEETVSNPSIDYVTTDAVTGKYKIQWSNPEKTRPEAIGTLVYRETATAGKFELMAELPLSATEYIDQESNPDIMANRYVIAYKLTFGRSRYSHAHQPVHVMINRGAGSSWNLIWGRYEGETIPQYRILRGDSPETLQAIAEVSGNMTSYTDFTAPANGALYYAVESVIEPASANNDHELRKAPRTSGSSISNIVAAAGSNINMATSIKVLSANGNTTIDGSDEASAQSIQLIALINPSTATFHRPSWIVIDGENLINVDKSGNVTPTGNGSGSATVRAMTMDGSSLYADINITVTGYNSIEGVESDKLSENKLVVYPVPTYDEVNIVTDGEDTDIYIFSLGGSIAAMLRSDAMVTTVDCSGWTPGMYIVKTVTRSTGVTRSCRLIKR